MTTATAESACLLLDRDLSWLEFNRRVLHEALDPRTPLLERVKFLAIFSNNLDEFFMKRVGVLKRRQVQDAVTLRDGSKASAQLQRIRDVVVDLLRAQADAFRQTILP